jgi:hypothetical protein
MNALKQRRTTHPTRISVTVPGYEWKVEISIKSILTKIEVNGSVGLVIEDD